MDTRRLRVALAVLAVGALGASALSGCGGPERAPHQPVTGVDRPADERAPNPHDVEPQPERESRTQN